MSILDALALEPAACASQILLAASILALWFAPYQSIWLGLAAVSLVSGLYAERISLDGAVALFSLAALTWLHYKTGIKRAAGILAFLVCLPLQEHLLPGFRNWRVLEGMTLSEQSAPFTFWLNWDKPFTAVFLIGWGWLTVSNLGEWRKTFVRALVLTAAAVPVLLGPALLSGYVRPDFKWPAIAPIWMAVNLLHACVAEEALFRGLLQRELEKPFDARWAWFSSAVIFGLSHYSGGLTYVGLTMIAGLFYGYPIYKGWRLEVSILAHFGVNLIHFLFFTYPAAK